MCLCPLQGLQALKRFLEDKAELQEAPRVLALQGTGVWDPCSLFPAWLPSLPCQLGPPLKAGPRVFQTKPDPGGQ